MSCTKDKALKEFEILEKTVDKPIILPFKDEILALVDKFGNSGQSGGSAPYTASALSQAVKTLCMQNTLSPLTGEDDEWNDVSSIGYNSIKYQNNRDGAVFKNTKDEKAYYLNAIVFNGDITGTFTSNSIKLKDGTKIKSSQFIKEFPFKPKTFYVDVIETEWADKTETIEKEGGGWWTSIIKDEKQLKEVFEYYENPILSIERAKKIKKITKK